MVLEGHGTIYSSIRYVPAGMERYSQLCIGLSQVVGMSQTPKCWMVVVIHLLRCQGGAPLLEVSLHNPFALPSKPHAFFGPEQDT